MADSSVRVAPRRLSKPRTNKFSSNLLNEQPTTPSSPHNSSDYEYFGRDAVVVNSHGERRSRSKSRTRIRAYLYGSSHEALQTSSDDDEAHTRIAGAARDVKKRLSRTGSSITSLHTARASATRLSNSSSSGPLSTHSTDSQGMDPEDSAMIADQIKQRAYHDGLAAQNHVSTPVDEDKHVDSIMAPLRRKSLYTPGIATRNASDILRKPPKPLTDHNYYYDPSRPESSPLSHLAALSVGDDGRSTPCDLHYSQLGGLQLGTLRVVNGAGSPVPGDLAYRSATPESKINDEFYTASEGSVTGDGKHATPLSPRAESPLKYERKLGDSIRTDNRVPSSPKCSPFERESSNESSPSDREETDRVPRFEERTTSRSIRLRKETSSDVLLLESGTSNGSLPSERKSSKPCPIEAMVPINPPIIEKEASIKAASFGRESRDGSKNFEAEKSKVPFSSPMDSTESRHTDRRILEQLFSSKSEMPNEIINFEGAHLSEVIPKTRSSKFSAVEGITRKECAPVREKSTNGASEIADEYIAELDDNPFSCSSLEGKKNVKAQSQDFTMKRWRSFINDDKIQHASDGNSSREDAFRKLTVNGNTPSAGKRERLSVPPVQPSRHSAPSGMPQTDSGYLRSVSADEVCFRSGVNPSPSTEVTASPQPHAVEVVRSSARSPFRVPLRKLKKQRPKSQPPLLNPITGYHELTDANIPRIPSVIAARHANRLSQFPLLEHTFPSSQHTTANGAFSPVQARNAPIRFPSPANALETAPTSLESFQRATSKPRAQTIAVDEDAWGASNLVRSPSWSEFGCGKRRKERKKLAKEEKWIEKRLLKEEKELERRLQKDRKELERQISKDEIKQRSNRPRSASGIRVRSSEGQSRHDVTIADFGTVTESLGKSPYDIATPTFLNPQIARSWHPHQISTAMSRPKPTCSIGTRSQSMFLDQPSVPALAAVDLRAHSLEWVRNRQRSQNSSATTAESFNDRGTIPQEMVPPHSLTMEVTPPVPALPSANQVQRREAEINRSRPHKSMIVEAPVPGPTLRETDEQMVVPDPSESGANDVLHKMKGSKIIPDLWSNGSLERKNTRIVQGSRQASNSLFGENDKVIPTRDDLWETHSNAWSQRRKSAGEALLRNQATEVLDSQEGANPALLCGHNDRPTSLDSDFTFEAYQTSVPTPSHLGPFWNPLASHSQSTVQQPTSMSNTPGYNQSTTQQVQRHSCSPLALPQKPSVSSLQHECQPPNWEPSRERTQPFQIQRKRVGSGPSLIGAESGIGSSRYEGVVV